MCKCKGVLPWAMGGGLLAIAFFSAVLFVKPIGVSTQFVIADAIVWDMVNPDIIQENAESKTGYGSENAYLNKSGGKYAKNAANPLNYSFVFVLAMVFGAFLSSRLSGDKPESKQEATMPKAWSDNFGNNPRKRYIWAFIAGFIVLFGARLAGGCTSGHMMSGMMQTSLSGYLFAIGLFATSIPLAIILYKKR